LWVAHLVGFDVYDGAAVVGVNVGVLVVGSLVGRYVGGAEGEFVGIPVGFLVGSYEGFGLRIVKRLGLLAESR
jgi:uncharacterized protein YcfJ